MAKDKVLVIGSGGREHALAWKLAQSPHIGTVYVAPGNGGTVGGKYRNVTLKSREDIADFALHNEVSLVVPGPEQPLVDGITDYLSPLGIRVFGPSRKGAYLEGSKIWAKLFMEKYDIPTADFKIVDLAKTALDSYKDAVDFLFTEQMPMPAYIKKDGLAAGKGALAAYSHREALDALARIMLLNEFGDKNNGVVIEKLLRGEEASCMAFINTEKGIITTLLPSQDHKKAGKLVDDTPELKIYNGETGPNTGGMGAYAPTKLVTPEIDRRIMEEVLKRTVAGMQDQGISYTGFLYPGLMIGEDGLVNVLEYNVRAGDPETQPVLALMESDLYEAMTDVIEGRQPEARWKPGYSVCVVLVSDGYPGKYETGKKITGLDEVPQDAMTFHAGTRKEGNDVYSSGGRVLSVTTTGATISDAIDNVYGASEIIKFNNKALRMDIGRKELMRTSKR